MPFIQRNAAGAIIGRFANRQPGFAEEFLSDDSQELVTVELAQRVADERAWRDGQLDGLVWLRDRHRDQLEIGVTTTLMSEQFAELLVFMQALRDWPQSEAFPDTSARPVAPVFLEQVRVEQ